MFPRVLFEVEFDIMLKKQDSYFSEFIRKKA
jgi:hypothetical protein